MPHLVIWLGKTASSGLVKLPPVSLPPPPPPPTPCLQVVMKTCLLAKQISTFALLDCGDDLSWFVFAHKQRVLTAARMQAAPSVFE